MGKHYEWTRAVEDQSVSIPKERERASLEGSSVISLDGRSGISTGAIPGNVNRVSLEGLCRKIVRVRAVISPCLLSSHNTAVISDEVEESVLYGME